MWIKRDTFLFHRIIPPPSRCVLTCSMSTIFLSSVVFIPEACCMVKPLKFSIRTNPLIWVSSFSSSFSRITQYALSTCNTLQRVCFKLLSSCRRFLWEGGVSMQPPHQRWSPPGPSCRCWRAEPHGHICLCWAEPLGSLPRWCCGPPRGWGSQTTRDNPSWSAHNLEETPSTESTDQRFLPLLDPLTVLKSIIIIFFFIWLLN